MIDSQRTRRSTVSWTIGRNFTSHKQTRNKHRRSRPGVLGHSQAHYHIALVDLNFVTRQIITPFPPKCFVAETDCDHWTAAHPDPDGNKVLRIEKATLDNSDISIDCDTTRPES